MLPVARCLRESVVKSIGEKVFSPVHSQDLLVLFQAAERAI